MQTPHFSKFYFQASSITFNPCFLLLIIMLHFSFIRTYHLVIYFQQKDHINTIILIIFSEIRNALSILPETFLRPIYGRTFISYVYFFKLGSWNPRVLQALDGISWETRGGKRLSWAEPIFNWQNFASESGILGTFFFK